MFYENGVLKNFAEFKGKHLYRSLKIETLMQVFSGEFREIFKNTYFHRTPSVVTSGARNQCVEKMQLEVCL